MVTLNNETKYKQGGNVFIPLKTVVRESYGQFYSETVLEVSSALSPTETIQIGDTHHYVRDIGKGSLGISYTLMPAVWAKATGVLSEPQQGANSSKKLLGDLGVPTSTVTGAIQTTLPASTLRNTMNHLKESGSAGGRGFFLTIDSGGKANIVCPQTALGKKTDIMQLAGNVIEQNYSTDWVHMTPGLVYLIFYTDEGIEEEILRVTPAKHTLPVVHYYYSAFLHDTAEKEAIRNRFRNAYWYNYYTTQTIKLQNTSPVNIGSVVDYAGKNYLVWETETAFTGGSVESSVIIVNGP